MGGAPGEGVAGALVSCVGSAVRGFCSTVLGFPAMKSVEQGAATTVYAALSPDLTAATSGAYLADCGPGKAAPAATDDALADALWEASAKATGVGQGMKKKK